MCGRRRDGGGACTNPQHQNDEPANHLSMLLLMCERCTTSCHNFLSSSTNIQITISSNKYHLDSDLRLSPTTLHLIACWPHLRHASTTFSLLLLHHYRYQFIGVPYTSAWVLLVKSTGRWQIRELRSFLQQAPTPQLLRE